MTVGLFDTDKGVSLMHRALSNQRRGLGDIDVRRK